ncbi:MAG TPA: protein-glutamate O-methyltransferase CheR [Longimicrobiales bacterium]
MTQPRGVYSLPLAHGELSEKDALELRQLKEQIRRDVGFYCDGYKEHCLRRRIAVRMRARGLHSYADYAALLLTDAQEYQKLRDAVTINVSKFYRNPEVWQVLDQRVLPELFASDRDIRVWSAGCAGGEEPYSIAMLLREHATRTDQQARLAHFDVLGTDIDTESLETARRATYTAFAFTDIDPALRAKWFEPPDHLRVRSEIREAVRFQTLDLITSDFDQGYDVIFCRNVVIYFERVIQEALFAKFHAALAPGGILVLGKVETLFGRSGNLYTPLAQRERVFIKR